jgi:putative ABC transport system permease protein
VPGRLQPIPLAVGGLVDMSQATTLFASRAPETIGDFIYVPDAVVVPPDLFDDLILAALRQDAASPTPLLGPPVIELDVKTDRAQLNANPSLAFTRARGLRRSIERVAPGQVLVVDNLSNALNVAKSDAIVAKVMFLFLGLPGVLLAAFLAGYAGSLLAQAQRREMAILRGHGAQQRHLMRALAYKTVAVAILGSLMGLGIALLTLGAILGRASLLSAAPEDLISSAAAAAGAGVIATAIALYIPGRRSLARETTEERREMEVARPPVWMRLRLDFVLLAVAGAVEVITYLGGGFSPRQTEGQALTLSFYVLLTPMLAWFGAILLGARLVLMGAPRIPGGGSGRFGTLVGGTLRRSLKRRSRNLAAGIIGVGLTLGFGTSAAIFIATYHAEKAADTRFEVGSDLRVTPSALTPQPPSYASQLLVPGAEAASPVVFHAANSALGTDKKDMAAIDAPSLQRTSHLSNSFFLDTTAAAAMAAMKADPAALLVDWEIAQDYGINTGDALKVQVTDVNGRESSVNFRVIGRYNNFPGLTQHVDLIANLGFYQKVTGRTNVDFFLVRSKDSSPAAVAALAAAIRSGPGRNNPLLVDTTANALRRDQSSLAALNLNGLGALDSLYTALMSAAAISIFVLGLTLQRRKEYVTMRALGARTLQLQILLVGEAGLVAVGGVVLGGLVGGAMAYMYVQVLRPVFTLPPEQLTIPADRLATLAGLVLGAMALSALAASGMLRRLKPMELLREE